MPVAEASSLLLQRAGPEVWVAATTGNSSMKQHHKTLMAEKEVVMVCICPGDRGLTHYGLLHPLTADLVDEPGTAAAVRQGKKSRGGGSVPTTQAEYKETKGLGERQECQDTEKEKIKDYNNRHIKRESQSKRKSIANGNRKPRV